jgi:cation:H+ antiporter
VWLECLMVAVAIAILWKCADWFVEGAVGIAHRLQVPKMLVGLVLVSLCTTAPELMTSLLAALQGMPQLALGNAVGSVIVDAGVALGLAAVISSTPLTADPRIFRSSALMLITALFLAFFFCLDGALNWWEGGLLLTVYIVHTVVTYINIRRRQRIGEDTPPLLKELDELELQVLAVPVFRILTIFILGMGGVLLGSELLLIGAKGIGLKLGISEVVLGLTVAAIGTSMPEIATCVAAALKRQGDIGIGNIIGADILNICWVAGLSALANPSTPLAAEMRTIYFMFPAVIIIVLSMLWMLSRRYELTRRHGVVLLSLYAIYTVLLFVILRPGL